ncbi:MAG: undecaprenyl-diphosphate phosphatase, partial [Phycisphaerae bacterium]|nr:undecaprenyl-diphosphate phosphatase [Phycisphaerae bacterium]
MTLLDAAILGLVEGVTEYLPVSSTGHLILTARLLGIGGPGEQLAAVKEAIDSFSIVIQGGAILAVAGLYRGRIRQMAAGLVATLRDGARLAPEAREGVLLLRNLVLSFLPAAVIGVLLAPWIKRHLFHPWPVVAALAAGGVLLLAIGRWQRRRQQGSSDPGDAAPDGPFELSAAGALIIGFVQVLAMWPGTSRSMVTILAGMLVGLGPRRAAEYSFLLALPTLGGATIYELARAWNAGVAASGSGLDGLERLVADNGGWLPSLVGLVVA